MLKKAPLLGSMAVAAALVVAGCGAPTTAGQGATPAASHSDHAYDDHNHDDHGHGGHDDKATETLEASPRLVVATETGVAVLDEKLVTLATFTTEARPTLTTVHDGRHVAAVQGTAGKVNIIDAGSWAQGHGEHFHYFTAEPALLDEALKGGKPVHVVGHAKAHVTAVYFDEAGSAQLLTTEALEHHELDDLKTTGAKAPHHGVIVPLADGTFLVSQRGADALPDTIDHVDAKGVTTKTFDCKGLHGETVVGTTAAFGCSDSIVIIRDGVETRIANPDASGERVGAIVADRKARIFVGDWAADSLVFITNDQAKVVEVGAEFSNIAVTPDGRFTVIGTDGNVGIYDATGAETERYPVTQPWTKPTGHGALAPSIAAGDLAGAAMIWVTEPDAGKVHALDLFAKKVTSADVAGTPGSLAVANAG